jgi:hypothetical protein
LGPGSFASLFISVSSGKENPCAEALKIAGEGTPKTPVKSGKEKEQKGASEKKGKKQKGASEKKEKEQKGASQKKKEGLGTKIKNLFSTPKE